MSALAISMNGRFPLAIGRGAGGAGERSAKVPARDFAYRPAHRPADARMPGLRVRATTALLAGIALAVLLLASGCKSVQPPYEQIAVSRLAVEDAVNAGADEFAQTEIASARDKLEKARVLAGTRRKNDLARRLAEEAEVDARLAAAKARNARAQRAQSELDRSMRSLSDKLTAPPAR